MKLLTKAIEKQLAKYPIYSQDGKGGKAQVICKFFNPCGSQTWYILEGEKQDDDYILFALLDNMGEREYGYVSLNELQRVRTRPFGLGIEREYVFHTLQSQRNQLIDLLNKRLKQ